MTLSNVETMNLASGSTVTAATNISKITGLDTVNVTSATTATVTSAATTDINISGASVAAIAKGGKEININVDSGANVLVQDTNADTTGTYTTDVINVTTTTDGDAVSNGTIDVDGGSDVTVTANVDDDSGAITIGGNGKVATGTTSLTVNVDADGQEAGGLAVGDIDVTGGTAIDVNVNLASDAFDKDSDTDVAFAGDDDIALTASTDTTSISVTQTATTTTVTKDAVAASTESASVKFDVLKEGDSITIDVNAGAANSAANAITFTASKDLTAAEVASAFANMTANDTQTATGPVSNGYFTGVLVGYTTGAATTDTVVFTSTAAATAIANNLDTVLVNTSGNSVDATVTITEGGVGGSAKDVSGNTIALGEVDIDENATAASVTHVTVDGYGISGASTAGAGQSMDAITHLSLANNETNTANAANAAAAFTLHTTKDTLTLTLDNVHADIHSLTDAVEAEAVVSLDGGGATIETLNVVTANNSSRVDLTAAAVTTLNVSGDALLDLSADSLNTGAGILETVTVTGDAGLKLHADEANTLISVDASATTGNVTLTMDTTIADNEDPEIVTAYKGGSGTDSITLVTDTTLVSKMDLGAGNDTLTLAANTTAANAEITGGEGTDTLSMDYATANAVDNATAFSTLVTDFEKLKINGDSGDNDGVLDTDTVNVKNLGYNYVITSGTLADNVVANSDVLALANMQSNDTVELTADGIVSVVLETATAETDVLNVVANVPAADLDVGTLVAADIETINISSNDTSADEDADNDGDTTTAEANPEELTLDLNATSATTINLSGSAAIDLDNTGNTKVTTINASDMTAKLTVTAAGGVASTITGGSGNDQLTASAATAAAGAVAQVSTLAFTEGNAPAAMVTGDKFDVTINGVTVTQVFNIDWATTLTALEAKVEAMDSDAYTSVLNGDVLTITANNAGTAFTADAVFTHAVSDVVIDNVVNGVNDGDDATIDFTDGAVLMDANDVITLKIDYDAGEETVIQAFDTDWATTIAALDDKVTALDADLSVVYAGTTFTVSDADGADDDIITAISATFADQATTATDAFATTVANVAGTSGAAKGDTLIGGAGDDTLIISTGSATLTGGDGADTFFVGTAASNLNATSAITDLESTDVIQFNGATSFVSAATVLDADGNPNLTDYANAAIEAIDANEMGWFQFNSNTYIVSDEGGANAASFDEGTDMIIKINGATDLSTASFNMTDGTLEIA